MARLVLAVPLGFALAACSSLAPGDEAPRTPSLRVASAALASGAPDVALRVADITLAKDPKDVAALIAKGDALYAMGDTEAAKAAYRSAIALDPDAAGAQLGLGRTLIKSDPAGAESAFLAALRTNATSIIALNNLGVARDLEGRNTEAQEAYHLALELSPNSDDVKINLGRSLAAAGHNAEAVAVLHQVAADPQAAQQWHNPLVAALNLAGDGAWAQQALGGGPEQPATPVQPGPALAALDTAPPSIASKSPPPVALAKEHAAEPPPPNSVRAHGPVSPLPAPRPPVLAMSLPPMYELKSATGGEADGLELSRIIDSATLAPSPEIGGISGQSVPVPVEPLYPHSAGSPSGTHGPADLGAYVQVGSMSSPSDAMVEWRRLGKLVPDILGGREPAIAQADVAGKTYWRLRTFGFASMKQARDLCTRLQEAGLQCWSGLGL
jgi:Flp pilus assembly protein TadD